MISVRKITAMCTPYKLEYQHKYKGIKWQKY